MIDESILDSITNRDLQPGDTITCECREDLDAYYFALRGAGYYKSLFHIDEKNNKYSIEIIEIIEKDKAEMTRAEAISILESMIQAHMKLYRLDAKSGSRLGDDFIDARIEALKFAVGSLKTDELYQLECEKGVDND